MSKVLGLRAKRKSHFPKKALIKTPKGPIILVFGSNNIKWWLNHGGVIER